MSDDVDLDDAKFTSPDDDEAPEVNEDPPVAEVDDTEVDDTEADEDEAADDGDEDDEADEDGEDGDGDDDDEDDDTATATITVAGKEYTVPKALEAGYLMQEDYTIKTQTLAQQMTSFEEHVGAAEAALALQGQQFEGAAQIRALDIQLAQYDEVDWQALMTADPATFQQLDFEKRSLQESRYKANQDLAYKSEEVSQAQHQMRAKAGEKTRSDLTAKYKDWTPALEEDMAQFAIKLGVPERQVRTTTNKATLEILYMANKWAASEAARTAAATKKPAQKKAVPAKKLARSGKQGGATDPDNLPIEKWVKMRDKQIAKRNAA
jgi:hypothetical protein